MKIEEHWEAPIREIAEFQQLAQVENQELEKLTTKQASLLDEVYITTCTLYGIQRLESFLGLSMDQTLSLEERRDRIWTIWNRRLPYTDSVLEKWFDQVVGKYAYELKLTHESYRLDVTLLQASYAMLKEVKKQVAEMIPANLLFELVANYREIIQNVIQIEAYLRIQSDFYPRYNLKTLLLDGTWKLDGTYLLNGYQSDQTIDFYPLYLTLWSSTNPIIWQKMQEQVIGEVVFILKQSTIMTLVSEQSLSTQQENQLGLQVEWIPHIGREEKIKYHAGLVVEVETSSASTGHNENKVELLLQNKELELIQEVTAMPRQESHLTIEKDLWFLDGTVLLDGSRLLDAKIIEYQL